MLDNNKGQKPEQKVEEKPRAAALTSDATAKAPYPEHTIGAKESLWGIARQYGISLKALYQANKDRFGVIEDASGKVFPPIYQVGDKVAIPAAHDGHKLEAQFRKEHEHKGGGVYVRKGDKPAAGEAKDAKIVSDLAAAAKHKQEVAEKAAAQKAAAEKQAAERLAAEHKSAQHEAAMLMKELKFREINHQANHEGQGWVDDFSDAVKTHTGLDREHSSKATADEFKDQEKELKILAKAAENKDLTQFKNLYHSYTNGEFQSGYHKPANLAFLDPGKAFSESQEQWRDNTTTVAAGVAGAALLFVPGGQVAGAEMEAQVATTLATRAAIMALRTGVATELGGFAKSGLQYSNQGDEKEMSVKNLVKGGVAAGTAQLAGELAMVKAAAVFAPGTHLGVRMVAASGIGAGAGGFSGAITHPVNKYYEAKEKHLPYGPKEALHAARDGFIGGAEAGAIMGPLARLGGEGAGKIIASMRVQGRVIPAGSTAEENISAATEENISGATGAASTEAPKVVPQPSLDKVAPPVDSPVYKTPNVNYPGGGPNDPTFKLPVIPDKAVTPPVDSSVNKMPSANYTGTRNFDPTVKPSAIPDKAVTPPVDSSVNKMPSANYTDTRNFDPTVKPSVIPDKAVTPPVDSSVNKMPSANYTGTRNFDPTVKPSAIPDKAVTPPADSSVNKMPSANYTDTRNFDPTVKPPVIPDKAVTPPVDSSVNKNTPGISMPKDLPASQPKSQPTLDKAAPQEGGADKIVQAPGSTDKTTSVHDDVGTDELTPAERKQMDDLFAEHTTKSAKSTDSAKPEHAEPIGKIDTGAERGSLSKGYLEQQGCTKDLQTSYRRESGNWAHAERVYSKLVKNGEKVLEVETKWGADRSLYTQRFREDGTVYQEKITVPREGQKPTPVEVTLIDKTGKRTIVK